MYIYFGRPVIVCETIQRSILLKEPISMILSLNNRKFVRTIHESCIILRFRSIQTFECIRFYPVANASKCNLPSLWDPRYFTVFSLFILFFIYPLFDKVKKNKINFFYYFFSIFIHLYFYSAEKWEKKN